MTRKKKKDIQLDYAPYASYGPLWACYQEKNIKALSCHLNSDLFQPLFH